MAVTTTPEDILEGAYSKSTKNNPGAIATESTELLQVVIRMIRKFYTIAARVNPLYFAESVDVAAPGADTPWARPEGAESIFFIEDPSGDEVVVVDAFDRDAESGKPAVYRMGKAYYATGNSLDPDPSDDALTFWYSRRPDDPASLTATIDSMWEEQFNELIMLEVAMYLAIKDSGTAGRDVELAALKLDRDEYLRLFIMFLEHETVRVRKRFGHISRFVSESMIPLNDLMVGGTSVKISRGGN
jgi:hypothetical protein